MSDKLRDDEEKASIDFASAKNFWQTRAAAQAPSRSNTDSSSSSSSSSAVAAVAPAVSTKSAAATVATAKTNSFTAPASLPNPSTPNEKYPDELEEEVEEPKAAPPPAPAPVTAAATSALNRMASFRPKFFQSSSGDSKSSEKENDSSPSAASGSALPSISVPQLPDMSSWKEKMKISRPTPPKMSFSFEKLKTTLSSASLVSSDADKAAARNNIQRPTQPDRKRKTSGATASASASAAKEFGELIVAEVLAAKDLSAGDYFQGENDSYVVVKFQESERRTEIIKSTKSPVFNERFVFWVPAAETGEPPELVSIVLMNKNLVMNDMHLGEVHIALDIPLNDAFDEWYPLVKENGEQRGHARVGVRRMALTSKALQEAAQALAANNRSLNDEDLVKYGSVIPDLWYGFAEAAEPLETKVSQADVLATKLNDLSRRFIGIELTSTEVTADGQRRDIF